MIIGHAELVSASPMSFFRGLCVCGTCGLWDAVVIDPVTRISCNDSSSCAQALMVDFRHMFLQLILL